MKRLIEFPLEDGSSIIIEVNEEDTEDSIVQAARPGEIAARASQTFEAALEKVRPAAGAVVSKLRSLKDTPDEISVEFGLKLNAEAGAVVAAAGVEANYKVTLKWQQNRPKNDLTN